MAFTLPDVATKSQSEARADIALAATRVWDSTFRTGIESDFLRSEFSIEDMHSVAYELTGIVQETIGSPIDRLAEALYDVEHANGKNALNAMGALVAAAQSVVLHADKILGGNR